MPTVRPRITPDIADQMKAMRDEGKTYSEIGQHFGFSGAAVSNHIAGRRAASWSTTFNWTKADDDLLMQLYDEGLTRAEIGKRIGVSMKAVAGRLTRIRHWLTHSTSEPRKANGGNRVAPHLEKYHRARRGFHVPGYLQGKYFDLLKAGVPVAETARRLGLSGGS